MYDQRVKVFIGLCIALLLMCVARLAQMQLLAQSAVQDEIAKLKERRGQSRQLKTLRGKILDRHGNVLAADTPKFQVNVNYQLSCYLDERVVRGLVAEARQQRGNPSSEEKALEEVADRMEEIDQVITECSRFGAAPDQIKATLDAKNNQVWKLRSYLAWRRGAHDPNLLAKYENRVDRVPFPEAMADLVRQYPDPNDRYRRVLKVDDIPELQRDLPMVELQTEDDVFAAQLEFRDMDDVKVQPTGHRVYPYGETAAQTIGWVGPATQARDMELFEDDPQASYLSGEVCGREDGVEYVCETILRGRRGELVYDIDQQLVRQTETQFGQDVQLTLDIELQRQIERWLSDPNNNPLYYQSPMAAAVIEIGSGDILALVSLPSYDLNAVRSSYVKLRDDVNHRPLINKAINDLYPPGSVVKPVVLIAGLESGTITPDQPISCPAAAQAKPPNCWIFKQYGAGHDGSWINNARNALRGSCNVYFAELADRLEPRLLQEWMFKFGYGRQIPLTCPVSPGPGVAPRSFRQAAGQIASTLVPSYTEVTSFDQIPPLRVWQRRLFGIGHGDFRVTPLQVANAFAALARGGLSKTPRLFLAPAAPDANAVDLHVSTTSLATIADGMHAVVNESGGTAHDYFKDSDLRTRGVTIYGKTGSTENPEVGWFAGYAADRGGVKIALAVVIFGGEHGGRDAAPPARAIFEMCADAGYVGNGAPSPRP
ncbi:MAG: penicillin-binding transpeptidase domain-containing protein [Phycisphaerales bacterium]